MIEHQYPIHGLLHVHFHVVWFRRLSVHGKLFERFDGVLHDLTFVTFRSCAMSCVVHDLIEQLDCHDEDETKRRTLDRLQDPCLVLPPQQDHREREDATPCATEECWRRSESKEGARERVQREQDRSKRTRTFRASYEMSRIHVSMCTSSKSQSMTEVHEDTVGEEGARARQRERMLHLWKWLARERQAEIFMARDVSIRATLRGIDGTRQQLLVSNLHAPVGQVPHAILRGTDVYSLRVESHPMSKESFRPDAFMEGGT